MKKYYIFYLLFLATIPLQAQELVVKLFQEKPNDLAARTHDRKDNNDKPCALIRVQLAYPGATFDIAVGEVEFKTNEYWVYISEDSKRLTVRCPGFLKTDIIFSEWDFSHLSSKTTYELVLTPEKNSTNTKIRTTQYLIFHVTPPNATLYVDDELRSLNAEGEFQQSVLFGKHTYRVEAAGYKSETGTAEVTLEKMADVKVELQSLKGTLIVNCADKDADIVLDNEVKGHCNWTGKLLPGTYRIEARREYHETIAQEIKIDTLEEKMISLLAPPPILGKLQIESEQIGADVYVDGKYYAKTPCFLDDSAKLYAGNHEVKLTKAGYADYTADVFLKENEWTILSEIKMEKLPEIKKEKRPALGTLYVRSNPQTAIVSVDGTPYGNTPCRINNLSIGPHHVEITKDGYADYTLNMTIKENEETPLNVKLEPKSTQPESIHASLDQGSLSIRSTSGGIIFIDGEYVGETPKLITRLSPGRHLIKIVQSGYKDYEKYVSITGGATTTLNATREYSSPTSSRKDYSSVSNKQNTDDIYLHSNQSHTAVSNRQKADEMYLHSPHNKGERKANLLRFGLGLDGFYDQGLYGGVFAQLSLGTHMTLFNLDFEVGIDTNQDYPISDAMNFSYPPYIATGLKWNFSPAESADGVALYLGLYPRMYWENYKTSNESTFDGFGGDVSSDNPFIEAMLYSGTYLSLGMQSNKLDFSFLYGTRNGETMYGLKMVYFF